MTDEQLSDLETFAYAAINKMAAGAEWSGLIEFLDGKIVGRTLDYIEAMPPETALAMIAEIRRLRGEK